MYWSCDPKTAKTFLTFSMADQSKGNTLPTLLQAVRARTPARILVGRSGPSYRTATQLELRQDHAAALDAVHADLDIARDFERSFVERWQLFEVQTQAADKTQYLMRPGL